MELFKAFRWITIPISLVIISLISINGQISTPCTASMISGFTPCVNYITGSSSNGTSPTQPTRSCCNSLKSLTGTGMDCACLLITANVPVQLPINRTLALSLPQACNMGGVPLQCKSSASPLAAPGPALLLTPPPTASLSPRASKAVAEAPAPSSAGTADDLQPTSPSVESEAPTKSPLGIGRTTPPASASTLSYVSPPSLLVIILGLVVYKSY